MEKPENVKDFLNLMNVELHNRARHDFDELQKIKNAETPNQTVRVNNISFILKRFINLYIMTNIFCFQTIMPWDTAYLFSKARKSWLGSSNEEFAPYFSLGACMEGLNILTQALYGVRLEHQPTLNGEIWSTNVHKLAVIDEDGKTLGHIYCDFFNREGKPCQDCHFTIRGGRQLPDGSYQVGYYCFAILNFQKDLLKISLKI